MLIQCHAFVTVSIILRKRLTPAALARLSDTELSALEKQLIDRAVKVRKLEEAFVMKLETYGVRGTREAERERDLVGAAVAERILNPAARHYSLQEGALLVRKIRDMLGLSQAALGERIGVDQATVNRWEAGRHKIKRAMWQALNRIADEAKARPREV